jgi:hypothetical protein
LTLDDVIATGNKLAKSVAPPDYALHNQLGSFKPPEVQEHAMRCSLLFRLQHETVAATETKEITGTFAYAIVSHSYC